MKLLPDIIHSSHNRFSFEIVPPLRGHCQTELLQATERLCEFNPAFISITNHPCVEEICSDDSHHLVKKRPGTFGISVAVKEQFGVHVIPHVIGLGHSAESFEDEVIDLLYAGFHDFFCIKGDHTKLREECPGYPGLETIDMIKSIKALVNKNYLYSAEAGIPVPVSIGIAGYPNNISDNATKTMQAKILEGGSWILTQMLFSVKELVAFTNHTQEHGITVPIIPGIRIITSMHTLELVEKTFSVTIPRALKIAFTEARTPKQEREAGIKFSQKLIAELFTFGAPVVHIFTMGKSKDVTDTLEGLRI